MYLSRESGEEDLGAAGLIGGAYSAVQWSSLYQLLPRTGPPWMCPGCTGLA